MTRLFVLPLAISCRSSRRYSSISCAKTSLRLPNLKNLAQRPAGLHEFRGEAGYLNVALVTYDDPLGCVEHHESLGHVVERDVELQALFPELFGFFALGANLHQRFVILK